MTVSSTPQQSPQNAASPGSAANQPTLGAPILVKVINLGGDCHNSKNFPLVQLCNNSKNLLLFNDKWN